MNISKPCVVSLTWTLSDAQNNPIDELTQPTEFFYGGHDLLERVEQALEGYEPGEDAKVQLEPEHAFGDYNSQLVCFEERSLFPDQLEVGMRFEGLPEGAKTEGMPTDVIYTVTEVYPSHVVLDGNHPLAGLALRLSIRVVDVREATDAEEAEGSVGSAPLLRVDVASGPKGALH